MKLGFLLLLTLLVAPSSLKAAVVRDCGYACDAETAK